MEWFRKLGLVDLIRGKGKMAFTLQTHYIGNEQRVAVDYELYPHANLTMIFKASLLKFLILSLYRVVWADQRLSPAGNTLEWINGGKLFKREMMELNHSSHISGSRRHCSKK